jgi:hypothetical protein
MGPLVLKAISSFILGISKDAGSRGNEKRLSAFYTKVAVPDLEHNYLLAEPVKSQDMSYIFICMSLYI